MQIPLALLLWAGTALADEPSGPSAVALATFWDKAEEARQAAIIGTATQIAQVKRDVEMAKRTPIKSNPGPADELWPVAWGLPKEGFPSKRAKEGYVAAKEKWLAHLTAWQANLMDRRREFLPEIDPTRPQIGAIGKIAHHVLNGEYAEEVSFKVVQIIDDDELLLDTAGLWKEHTYWVRNMNTEGLVDGARIKLDGVWSLTGTKRYENVLGAARTVYLLDKLDLAELRKNRPAVQVQPPPPMPTPAEPEKPAAKYVVHFKNGRKMEAVDYTDEGTRYRIESLGKGSGSYPKSMVDRIEPIEP